ncbi:MAG: response regulator [Chloroflexota bacterium]
MRKDKDVILIVDDNTDNLKIVGEQLREHNAELIIATSGEMALNFLSRRTPDLILLDVMMPEMDGFELCRRIKENPNTAETPIIFLTGKVAEEDVLRGFELGAVDYVPKPFRNAELLARVRVHIDLRRARKALQENNTALEKANLQKNELMGIAAHDLKNPIYSISMLAKLLRDEAGLSQEEVKEFAQDIVTSAERMLELIVSLLDLNALEDGRIAFHPECIELSETLEALVKRYKPQAEAKQIQINFEPNSEGINITADRNAVIQIFDNLISNAIKFSPFEKRVFVDLATTDHRAVVSVRDEGPGITKEDMGKLFGKFTKLSARPTAGENSTGLGLSIVKSYVEACEGTIRCDSEPGSGADFIVTFPLSTGD